MILENDCKRIEFDILRIEIHLFKKLNFIKNLNKYRIKFKI